VLAARLERLGEVRLTSANANRRNRASHRCRSLHSRNRGEVREQSLELALARDERVSQHRLGCRRYLAVAEGRANSSQGSSALRNRQLTLELDDLRKESLVFLGLLLLFLGLHCLNRLLDALGLLELGNSRSLNRLRVLRKLGVGSVRLLMSSLEQLADESRSLLVIETELGTVGSAFFLSHSHVSTL
jgi:hypothetical protein